MKAKTLLAVFVWLTCCMYVSAQTNYNKLAENYLSKKGEVILSFKIKEKSTLRSYTKGLSIVHFDEATNVVKVMANQKQYDAFLTKKIQFYVTKADNEIGERKMLSSVKAKAATFPLTAYPTYAAYEGMMNNFAQANPNLCKVVNIGSTTEGDKSLLFVKLSDNVNANEQEPRVMYTSSMHGDEIAGYPMMLNLIDFLLQAYTNTSHPRHAEIKTLLDTTEVWINPLANPDGTFRNSPDNSSVANAIRGNANNVDLNRNYPDPEDGPHPDGNSYQTETIAFMNFADSKHFVLSANFHGGIELINYPWDTYAAPHPDKDYFLHISEEYRDHCQADSPAGYFDDRNNGITNGYNWYEVQGGRQDYQIYFKKGREVTVELSTNKTPPASQLVNFWNYNKEALIAFLKQVTNGIHGTVTDVVTNEPIAAKVTIIGKEGFDSWVPTELPGGDYYRLIKAGTYSILYEAPCYESLTVTGVQVADGSKTIKNVQLTPLNATAPDGITVTNIQSSAATIQWNASSDATYDLRYRKEGTTVWTIKNSTVAEITITNLLPETSYEVQVRVNCEGGISSPYSASVMFMTTSVAACTGIHTFPYQESFENGLGVWENSTGDDIDWTRDSGGTPSASTGPSAAQDGNYYMYTEASVNVTPPGSPNKVALLTSPCIDLSTLNGVSLEFGYHMYGGAIGDLELLVSTDDGSTYSSLWSKNGNQGNSWKQANIDLTSYAGSVIKIQFRGKTGANWRSDIAIDNINIKSVTPDITAPSVPANLSSSAITHESVQLSWQPSTDNIGVTGYTIFKNDVAEATTTNVNYSITGLSANTSYSFYVKAMDAAGNVSEKSNTISVTTSEPSLIYCDAKGNNINYEFIDLVQIGGISNATGANGGYAYFENQIGTVTTGANTIVLSAGFTGRSYREYWNVWIDFDQNGTFDNIEEIVSANVSDGTNHSYNFTIPTTALLGNTRMRVAMKYNGQASACETFAYGEVEDYPITINSASLSSAVKGGSIPVDTTADITIYPNPITNNTLYIKTSQKLDRNTSYIIYNSRGKIIKREKFTNYKIILEAFSEGIYFLEITSKGKKIIKPFIIK